MRDTPPRVFISYAQESDAHSAWVLALAHELADWGVETVIDRFCDWPAHGWRAWMDEQIKAADWVLVVCTTEYLQRFEGNAPAGIGRGVRWESQHITQQLYDHKFRNKRFVPVLPPGEDEVSIPFPLKDYRSFRPDSQYEDLYRLLTDQPATPAPELGPLRRLPPIPVPTVADPTPAADSANAPERVTNPYPGLAAFTPEQHDIFLCYSRGDRAIADTLAARLRAESWSVFQDVNTQVGRRWHKEIERELHAARAVVALWSVSSRDSDYVLEEAEYGKRKDILFPAFIEQVAFPYGFGRIQTADLVGWMGEDGHAGLGQLLHALSLQLGSGGQA